MMDPPVKMPAASAKVADSAWGDEVAYYSQPSIGVQPDESWISVLGFWLTFPLNLIMAVLCAFSDTMLRWVASVARYSALNGRPLYLAWAWWWYQPAGAVRLVLNKKSRYELFQSSRKAFGGGSWWWHGEGAWGCAYKDVRATMASAQRRSPAFGAVRTAVPELFPAGILLFVDGEKHRIIRGLYESRLTQPANWTPRLDALPALLAKLAPQPCTLQTLDKPTSDKMVATAVWWLVFGVELSESQAATIAGWGAGGSAGLFVFPRLIHRIAFNLLLKKVITLRKATIEVFKSHGLQALAHELNGQLGPHAYASSLAFADILMYLVNFAGVGGTQHATAATLLFLQRKTIDVLPASVQWPEGSMPDLYKANPDAFVKEVVRLDAPVTSATCAFAEQATVEYKGGCCGGPSPHEMPEGTLHQYVLSVANRDPGQFESPGVFNPSRANLDSMVGWNGALDRPEDYPRICPGQQMSVAIIKAIVGLVEEVQ